MRRFAFNGSLILAFASWNRVIYHETKFPLSRTDFKRAVRRVDMTDNDTAALVAVSLFGALASLAFTINAIARAWVARGRDEARLLNQSATPLADARLDRLEQAVDAIALEVERISETQRFTTKLLSEQSRTAPQPANRQLSSDTPT